MKIASAWDQVVTYWECPECGFVHDLGNGIVWEDMEDECGKCKKKFFVKHVDVPCAMKKKKARNPRDLATRSGAWIASIVEDGAIVSTLQMPFNAKECRKLARWLERAASYIESKENKK